MTKVRFKIFFSEESFVYLRVWCIIWVFKVLLRWYRERSALRFHSKKGNWRFCVITVLREGVWCIAWASCELHQWFIVFVTIFREDLKSFIITSLRLEMPHKTQSWILIIGIPLFEVEHLGNIEVRVEFSEATFFMLEEASTTIGAETFLEELLAVLRLIPFILRLFTN